MTGTYKNTGGAIYLSTGTFTVNGIFDWAQNGGVPAGGLTWGAASVFELTAMTDTWPTFQGDAYKTVEIDCSGLTQNMEMLKDEISKFQNVLITNTGSYALLTDNADLTTISGNFTIAANGKLIIDATDQLTVGGAFANTVNANLLIKSTSSGTGSLIFASGTPNSTIQRYVSGDKWHLMGPPVASAPATTFLTGYMQRWHEYDGTSAGYWEVIETNPNLTRGTGDAFYFIGSNFTGSYTGQLLAADLTMGGLGNTTNDGTDGYHCLANPFASAVTWASCTATNVSAAVVYNGASYVAAATIPAQQGFFVQVDDDKTGSVTFTQASKTHAATTFYKSSDSPWGESIILTLSDNADKSSDQLIVRLDDNATFGYESEFDARKIEGKASAGEIFAQITEDDFACMTGVPFTENTIIIPVGFKKGDESEYTIELAENNFPNNVSLTLEDTENGQMINLFSETSYTFTGTDSDDNRFNLLISNTTGIDENKLSVNVNIWSTKDRIYIQSLEKGSYDIFVYSISGKLIESFENNNDELMSFTLNESKGAYIIKYISDNGSFSQKIIK